MKFFVDRSFPVRLCAALAALHEGTHEIIYHDDHFKEDTPDTEWIRSIGKWNPKPIVISGDSRILKRPDEVRELVSQNLTFLCLDKGWMSKPIDEFAWQFFKAWPGMVSAVSKCSEPSTFTVQCGSAMKTELRDLTKNLKVK